MKYHGKTPPTIEDAKLASNHLDRTGDLATKKIGEHEVRKQIAKRIGNKQSVIYNNDHIDKHKKELKKVNQSKKTLQGLRGKLKPIAKQIENG